MYTHVSDEDGLLEGDVWQGHVALGHSGLVGLAWELVLLLLHALEVRGNVRLAVSRRAEDLLAMRAWERAHA